jgi:RNA polymerase sigma factor (TIGR02999 family)
MCDTMSDVTRLLELASQGHGHAAEQLLPLVYDDLRRLAAGKMAHEARGQTLTPTSLVHEAYLRLVGPPGSAAWANRKHFFVAAAEAMRRILVDNARRKKAVKHGGAMARHDADLIPIEAGEPDDTVLAVHESLDALAAVEPVKAELVKLRFFGGFTTQEAADLLGVSVATAERYWQFARAWLFDHISEQNEIPPAG